ncbi:DUF1570 domain-containing protein [Thalassoglobus polymorphus]|nr:DUF1570 domain-containing protein [Thalassoglobus polymorphus]
MMNQTERVVQQRWQCYLCFVFSLLSLFSSSCMFVRRDVTGLPNKYKVKMEQLQVRSDVKITKDDPVFEELTSLRAEIVELLELPPANRPIIVHLFKDEDRYAEYMKKQHPNLPPRRAFFIGSPTELAVYAHWGPSMAEDLRHEYTHGVLHSSLQTVPLWLDEGIAEYFETRTFDSKRRHPDHAPQLAKAISNGWQPDLHRLEQIESVSEMHRADYQEAWAWVHYLIHDCPDGRGMLVDYCKSLRSSTHPPRFAEEMERHVPTADVRLASYISSTFNRSGPTWALGQDQQ